MERRSFLAATSTAVVTSGCLGSRFWDGSRPTNRGTSEVIVSATAATAGKEENLVLMDGSTDHNYGGKYRFDPIGLFVPVDATVTWQSGRGAPHSATAYPDRIPDGSEPFDSHLMGHQETYDHRFTVEGTYDYYCLPHETAGMVGRIVCGSPRGPPDGPTPGGRVPTAARIVAEGRVGIAEFDG